MQRPIIVFDSGKGGQSIYTPLRLALPDYHYLYLDDHENFPYGNKSPSWLRHRFVELAKIFKSHSPRLVVLACNTGTVNAIDILRQELPCPVIGVEPVIKPLAAFKRSLALMTTASANSTQTTSLLQKFGSHVRIFTPKGLAEAIEYNDVDQMKMNIHEIKEIVRSHNIEAVGLSCTHYPLILDRLVDAMPGVRFIDPSEAVVREIKRVLRLEQDESV